MEQPRGRASDARRERERAGQPSAAFRFPSRPMWSRRCSRPDMRTVWGRRSLDRRKARRSGWGGGQRGRAKGGVRVRMFKRRPLLGSAAAPCDEGNGLRAIHRDKPPREPNSVPANECRRQVETSQRRCDPGSSCRSPRSRRVSCPKEGPERWRSCPTTRRTIRTLISR